MYEWRINRRARTRLLHSGVLSKARMMSANRQTSGTLNHFRPSQAIYWRPFHVSFDDTVELFRLFRSTRASKHRSHSSKRNWLHLGRSVSLRASS